MIEQQVVTATRDKRDCYSGVQESPRKVDLSSDIMAMSQLCCGSRKSTPGRGNSICDGPGWDRDCYFLKLRGGQCGSMK